MLYFSVFAASFSSTMTTTPQWILVTIVATLMVQYGSAVELKIVSFNIEKFGRSENLWVNVQNKQLNNNAISQNAKIFAMVCYIHINTKQ